MKVIWSDDLVWDVLCPLQMGQILKLQNVESRLWKMESEGHKQWDQKNRHMSIKVAQKWFH